MTMPREKGYSYATRDDGVKLKDFILSNVGYDPSMGALYFYEKVGRKRMRIIIANQSAASATYGRCRIYGRLLSAARVAYLVKNGDWPVGQIEFENNDCTDIRWENMILVDGDEDKPSQPKNEEQDSVDESSAIFAANAAFLADLKRFHPSGPPTYVVKSKAPAKRYLTWSGSIGSAAGMCADSVNS